VGDDADRHVDVRVITATNKNLETEVKAGFFREDLFYRINVFTLHLPSLRERRSDIPILAQHFLLGFRERVGKRIDGFSVDAMAALIKYDFPGNVRELENKVHQAMIMARGAIIELADLQGITPRLAVDAELDLSRPFRALKRDVIDSFERVYLRRLLIEARGNVAAAARVAGMDRKNLWGLLKKHGVDASDYRVDK
jgi:DNA-binding NtrC family response regulator